MRYLELERLCKPDYNLTHRGFDVTMTFDLRDPVSGPNLLLKERFILCEEVTGSILQTFDDYPSKHDILTVMMRHDVGKSKVDKVFDMVNVPMVIHESLMVFKNQTNLEPKEMVLHSTLHYALANMARTRGALTLEADLMETYLGIKVQNAGSAYDEYHAITLRGCYK